MEEGILSNDDSNGIQNIDQSLSLVSCLYNKSSIEELEGYYSNDVFENVELYRKLLDQAETIGQLRILVEGKVGEQAKPYTILTYSPSLNRLFWSGFNKGTESEYIMELLRYMDTIEARSIAGLYHNSELIAEDNDINIHVNFYLEGFDIDKSILIVNEDISEINISKLKPETQLAISDWKDNTALVLKELLKYPLIAKYNQNLLWIR